MTSLRREYLSGTPPGGEGWGELILVKYFYIYISTILYKYLYINVGKPSLRDIVTVRETLVIVVYICA